MRKSTEKLVTVVFEPAQEGGYVAYVPAFPGCYSEGNTYAEAEVNIKEAIELYLEESNISKKSPKTPIISTVLVYA